MKTVSIFKNGSNQAIRLPKEMEFDGVTELEILKQGDAIILKPVKPNWLSLTDLSPCDDDFLRDREPVIDDEGRVHL